MMNTWSTCPKHQVKYYNSSLISIFTLAQVSHAPPTSTPPSSSSPAWSRASSLPWLPSLTQSRTSGRWSWINRQVLTKIKMKDEDTRTLSVRKERVSWKSCLGTFFPPLETFSAPAFSWTPLSLSWSLPGLVFFVLGTHPGPGLHAGPQELQRGGSPCTK